jgi:Icc-related predicted phosphoesterase
MLGLHGHIHESSGFTFIGDTLCINPGSEYGEGLLRGFIVELSAEKVEKYWKIQG